MAISCQYPVLYLTWFIFTPPTARSSFWTNFEISRAIVVSASIQGSSTSADPPEWPERCGFALETQQVVKPFSARLPTTWFYQLKDLRTIDNHLFTTAVLGKILPQILSSLTDLLWIDLDYLKIDSQLLAIINGHPTLASVGSNTKSFTDLPSDLSSSKIIFKFIIVSNKDPRSYVPMSRLRPGCGISQLCTVHDISGPETVTVTRLQDLRIQLGGKDLPWLPVFAARLGHPHLNSISFMFPSFEDLYQTTITQVCTTITTLFFDTVDGHATKYKCFHYLPTCHQFSS
ncbi:hypothetical protein C8J56DRAFT_1083870 [Mycena floridula]|nr:hypothetical protein C8J56DRAFT_1083870 [Mycena floridula]